jgi:hypothetical protein
MRRKTLSIRFAPQESIADDPDMLSALRGLFSLHPFIGTELPTSLRGHYKQGLDKWGPHEVEVEAALATLSSTIRSESSRR